MNIPHKIYELIDKVLVVEQGIKSEQIEFAVLNEYQVFRDSTFIHYHQNNLKEAKKYLAVAQLKNIVTTLHGNDCKGGMEYRGSEIRYYLKGLRNSGKKLSDIKLIFDKKYFFKFHEDVVHQGDLHLTTFLKTEFI